MAKGEKRDYLLLFAYFVIARAWLSFTTGSIIGVDAWDYLSWIKLSAESQQLMHAPLHVPGFYAFVSVIAIYTNIDPVILYTYVLPILFAMILYSTSKCIMNEWGLYISSIFGFYVIRTSMIIPEIMGLCLIPILIYSLLKYKEHKELQHIIMTLIISNMIIWSHHLSGAIALVILAFYTMLNFDRKMLSSLTASSLSAVVAWYTASGFPLELIRGIIVDYGILPLLLSIGLVSYLTAKNLMEQILDTLTKYLFLISPLLILLSVLVGYSVGLDMKNLAYWFPAIILLPLGTKFSQESKAYSFWVGSILLLSTVIVITPAIRPLLARLLVFNIQSFIPVAGITIAIILEKINEKKNQVYFVIIILSLLLTSFHSYPKPDAWFNTEFRYYDEELEAGVLISRFYTGNIDTDNRYGVMLRGLILQESTYGEIVDSWLAQSLVEGLSEPPPKNFIFIVNDVIRETGFMLGKFIHGEGGDATDVSIKFTFLVENWLNNNLSKVGQIGSNSIWVS